MSEEEIYPDSDELEGEAVRGPDFRKDFELEDLLERYGTTGFQASHLKDAVDIAKRMREENDTIFLTFTSNIVSSGLRETVAYLVREDLVDVLITTSGSHTEDVIKCKKDFHLGDWDVDEAELREKGINRLGNIFVPSEHYAWLENWLNANVFPDLFEAGNVTPTEVAEKLGKEVRNDPDMDASDSILGHAFKNDIPVFCPALIDAEIGNFMFYYRQEENPEAGVEILGDWDSLIHESLDAESTGIIAVGDGVPKHQAIMSNLFRGGADRVVYISTGVEGDGSLSGAKPSEAVSWGKIKGENKTNYIQVEAEATLVFPLIVAGAFAD